VIELGKLGLDCLIMSEPPADLGRACHCVSATLATMAANETCARFMMDAPGGSVVRSVLALVEASCRAGPGPRRAAGAGLLVEQRHIALTHGFVFSSQG
jgi:hypothetical protein